MDSALHSPTFEVEPLTGSIGSIIHGLDLASNLTDETIAALRRLWLERHVLFFRDQNLSAVSFKAFAERFGSLEQQPYIRAMADHPEIIEVVKKAEDRGVRGFGNSWHTDFSFQAQPPMATLLYALTCPAQGGDTLFVDMTAVYESFSLGFRTFLAPLKAVHSGEAFYGSQGQFYGDDSEENASLSAMEIYQRPEADGQAVHPVVRRHPETGRQSLFVNPGYTRHFEDIAEAESQPLLELLYQRAKQPEFTCRFRWQPGSLAFWDNRATLHYAVDDYEGADRHMLRLTLAGDRPV